MTSAPRLAQHDRVLVLENPRWRVEVLPGIGGSLASGAVRDGAEEPWAEILRPTPRPVESSSVCADFVLAPWSNRIRDGVLRFDGRDYPLPHRTPEGTAMHGLVRNAAWEVLADEPERTRLRFDSEGREDVGFPWPFLVEVEYRLEGAALVVETLLRNTGDEPFPGGIGHHPYFRRSLDGVEDVRLEVPAALNYTMPDLMPDGPAHPIEERIDYRQERPIGDAVVDDLFTGIDHSRPVRMVWPGSGRELRLHADPVFSHLIVYAPQKGTDFFAVEPVTNANDGFSLREDGVPGHGVVVLAPGEELVGAFQLELVR